MRFMFYSTTTGSRLHVANMHHVIYLCVIFVSVNTKIFTTHRSHISFLERGATTFGKANSPIKTSWYLVGNIQRSPQATPKAPDVKELPEPLLDSASIPVDGQGRPLSFLGTSTHRPLPKCCPMGKRLDARLERCEGGGGEGGGHLLTLRESESSSEGLRCGYGEILRLGAAEAADSARQLMDEGLSLKVREGNGSTEVVLSPGDFCADSAEGPLGPFALLLCPCAYTTCVRKCCPKGQLMVVHEKGTLQVDARCEAPSDKEFLFQPRLADGVVLVEDDEEREERGSQSKRKGFAVLGGAWPEECPSGFERTPPSWRHPRVGMDPKVFRDGFAIAFWGTDAEEYFVTRNYCVDIERRLSGILVESMLYCSEPETVQWLGAFLTAVRMVGTLALLAAIVLHCLLPEMRETPSSHFLMCYSIASLLSDVVSHSWMLALNISGPMCVFIVILWHYFQLASAFWLNVMCYDMGLAFRSYQRPSDRMKSVAGRRFLYYSLYAWGCPIFIPSIMLYLQLTLLPGDPWRPFVQYFMCDYSSMWHHLFLYVPILILLLLNLTQFILIAYRIRFLQKDSRILAKDKKSKGTSLDISRKQLLIFLKLLWAMGMIETVIQMSVWATGSELADLLAWNAFDFFRSLSILVHCCCENDVLIRLKEILSCGICPRRNRVADITVTSNMSSDNCDIQSTSVRGADSSSVRNDPFGEPICDGINPFVEVTNQNSNDAASAGINRSAVEMSDTSKGRLVGEENAGTIIGTISRKNDLNDEPTGDIEMRATTTSSL